MSEELEMIYIDTETGTWGNGKAIRFLMAHQLTPEVIEAIENGTDEDRNNIGLTIGRS